MKLKIEAASGIGSRMTQEDCLLLGEKPIETLPRQNVPAFLADTDKAPLLTAVLDGVGSCSYASLASSMTAAKIQSVFYSKEGNEQLTAAERLGTACGQACEKLAVLNQSFGSIQAATTLTAAAFSERQLHLWATGDSPAYLFRQNRLTPLFKPMGEGNRLLNFAGADACPEEFISSTKELETGDFVILATDGVLGQKWLLWALRLGLGVQTIVRLSTLRRFADNSTLIKIEVVEV